MATTFTIKGLKTFEGMEGYGFECSLYQDNKKVGRVFDEGSGGTPTFYINELAMAAFRDAAVDAYQDDPDMDNKWNTMFACEALIGRMVDDAEEKKMLKRMCRGKILFNLHGDEEGTWRTFKAQYGTPNGDKCMVHMAKKYGDKLNKVANRDVI